MRTRLLLLIALLALLVSGWIVVHQWPGDTSTRPLARPSTAAGPYRVRDVVDGDTLQVLVDQAVITVRLIGIDTPETKKPDTPVQCYGPEASARTKQLADGHQVWLEDDPSQGHLDKYGRTLAYVWIDQVLLNQTLVAEGFAHEYTYDKPYAYQGRFRGVETAAKAAQIGFWSASTCNGDTTRPR